MLTTDESREIMADVDELNNAYQEAKANGSINPRERRALLKKALSIVVKIVIDVID